MKKPRDPKMYMAVADAARRANVTGETIREWSRRGWLKVAAMTVSGQRLFDPADIEAFIRQRERGR